MNGQYEIAKIVTRSMVTDEVIDKELSPFTKKEWNERCVLLDKNLKTIVEVCEKEKQEEALLKVLKDIADEIGVCAATLWVAYLQWADIEYEQNIAENSALKRRQND